jgi:hypothetical protein
VAWLARDRNDINETELWLHEWNGPSHLRTGKPVAGLAHDDESRVSLDTSGRTPPPSAAPPAEGWLAVSLPGPGLRNGLE